MESHPASGILYQCWGIVSPAGEAARGESCVEQGRGHTVKGRGESDGESQGTLSELRGSDRVRASAFLLLVALVLGVVVGFLTFAVLRLGDLVQSTVWEGLRGTLPEGVCAAYPLVVCTVGGILVEAWTRRCGYTLDTLSVVVAHCRENAGYSVRSWGRSLVLFLLPIAFGGAVGPEAGISGFAAAGFTASMAALRRSGGAVADDPSKPVRSGVPALSPEWVGREARLMHKRHKAAVWAVAGIGFVLGAVALARLAGPAGALPRFPAIDYLHSSVLAALLALVLGWGLSVVGAVAGRAAKSAADRMSRAGVPRAVICGVVLGAVAVLLPNVLFSGESATGDLVGGWQGVGVAVLFATALAKVCLTKLCVACDWVGGEFFPLIFCGVSMGYVAAALLGVDPLLPVAVAAGAVVSASTRKPLLTVCVLALCFPLQSLPAVAVAAFVAAKLPLGVSSGKTSEDQGE
jgi:H+/Cl- antiporter ClcA